MKRPVALLFLLAGMLGLCVWLPGAATDYQQARALTLQAQANLETARAMHTVAWGNTALAWALAAATLMATLAAVAAIGYAAWTTRRLTGPQGRPAAFPGRRARPGRQAPVLEGSDPLDALVRLETLRLLREMRDTNYGAAAPALPPSEATDEGTADWWGEDVWS